MLALGINYLNGWSMAAADGAEKKRAEWPPHPDRIFMALAAAFFETGEQSDEADALSWLETQEPPAISASDACSRSASDEDEPTLSYVPVNDSQRGRKVPDTAELGKLKDAGLALLPEYRPRQARRFPVAIPHEPIVFVVWCDAHPGRHKRPLERLARKVTHVGHSASFVQMWLADAAPMPSWIPVDDRAAVHRLRVSGPGRLEHLRTRYNRDNVAVYNDLQAQIGEATGVVKRQLQTELEERFKGRRPVSLRPEPALSLGYGRPPTQSIAEVPGSVFNPRLVVLSLSGKRLSLPATLRLTEALRGAILAACPNPIPEWVSGHASDGKPTANPHLALLPLPFAAHEHSDGRLLGMALALPEGVEPREVSRCLGPLLHDEHGLTRRNRLFAGHWFECSAELETRETPPTNLQSEVWTHASRTWASVTPVVLDRHFDGEDRWERACETVKDSCERIGLPRPREVLLQPVSLVEGIPHVREFPRLTRKKDGGRMHHTHAVILFDEPVTGPVVIGAGRFRGYGLCRPMDRGAGHG